MTNDNTVKSLQKALLLLDCFSRKEPELGITELSERMGLYKSNAHNLVTTLEQFGYIERNPQTNKCRLGMKLLELAYVVNGSLGLQNVLTPIMDDLARRVNENVYFAIPNKGDIIYMEGAYPAGKAARSMAGERVEMFCTAIGKAILAFFPANEKKAALALQSMKAFTACTITSREELTARLDEIHLSGYSLDNMEHEFGIKCVAVPVFRRNGEIVGAMSISGPSPRFDKEAVKLFVCELMESARQISLRLV